MRDHVRQLTTGVAIYGAGDAAITVVNFLLLPLYIQFLSPTDFGALLTLLSIETFAKIVNRWGLDGAFMRYYLDRAEGLPRQRLASSILGFIVALDGSVLALSLLVSRWLSIALFGDTSYLVPLRLMLVNTFLIAFTFIPFHVMRLRQEARAYSALTFSRSAGTTALRLVFVAGFGLGLTGLYLADLVVTLALLPWLWRWTAPLIRPVFSQDDLRLALRFGLPRLPHGLAQQAFDYGNRLLLTMFVPLAQAGVYQNAATLGTGVKFFLASFETAWAPFYYATARRPDAKAVLSKITTYGVGVLALLVAGTAAVSRDLVLVMLDVRYLDAIPIVPIVSLAIACQGLYLLTSIGLNITSQTRYYPLSTFTAAGAGLAAGFLFMPSFGALGAALALLISFAVQAAVAFTFSRRVYPIDYEWGRLVRIVAAALIALAAARWLIPDVRPIAGLFARGVVTVAVYGGVLGVTGFFRATERTFIRETIARLRGSVDNPPVLKRVD